jgi:hypothetical protein
MVDGTVTEGRGIGGKVKKKGNKGKERKGSGKGKKGGRG